MNNNLDEIFKLIENLNISDINIEQKTDPKDETEGFLRDLAHEIQRVLDQNSMTQEELARLTGMSQSNISKILNCRISPRLETLLKIASATGSRLVIRFDNKERY